MSLLRLGVSNFEGAVIFDGSYRNSTSLKFAEELEMKFASSSLFNEASYVILNNQKVINPDKKIEEIAVDLMTGSGPAGECLNT
jgi:hypothetical protein